MEEKKKQEEEEEEEEETPCKEEEIIFCLGVKVTISNFSQHSFPSKDQNHYHQYINLCSEMLLVLVHHATLFMNILFLL